MSTGPQGFPDYQRVVNWDSSALINDTGTARVGSFTYPAVFVGRYAYLAMVAAVRGVPNCRMTVTWFSDAALSIGLGSVNIMLDPNNSGNCQLRLENLGAFAQITLASVGVANFTSHMTVIGSNRPYNIPVVPSDAGVIFNSVGVIGAGASVPIVPDTYFAGNGILSILPAAAPVTAELRGMDLGGTYRGWATVSAAANVRASVQTLFPMGAWEIVLTNTGGVNTSCETDLVPGWTG